MLFWMYRKKDFIADVNYLAAGGTTALHGADYSTIWP